MYQKCNCISIYCQSHYINLVYNITNTPITIVGGAKSYEEISDISNKYPILGFGVGSLFIYKGKNKAVLISYPKEHSKSN